MEPAKKPPRPAPKTQQDKIADAVMSNMLADLDLDEGDSSAPPTPTTQQAEEPELVEEPQPEPLSSSSSLPFVFRALPSSLPSILVRLECFVRTRLFHYLNVGPPELELEDDLPSQPEMDEATRLVADKAFRVRVIGEWGKEYEKVDAEILVLSDETPKTRWVISTYSRLFSPSMLVVLCVCVCVCGVCVCGVCSV